MQPAATFCLVLLLASAGAQAEQVVVRQATRVDPFAMRESGLSIELPDATFRRSLTGTWVSRSSGQPVTASFRPFPDLGVFINYTAEGRVEDGFSTGKTAAHAQTVGVVQRPALVAQVTETSALEAALENQLRIDEESQSQTVRKAELVAKTSAIPGLTLRAAGGQSENNDFLGIIKDQTYANLYAEQALTPLLPVRVRAAPMIGNETTRFEAASDRLLTGLDTALMVDAAAKTTLSFGATTYSTEAVFNDDAWSSHTYYTAIERELVPGATLRLRGGYEEQETNVETTSAGFVLGLESYFAITEALSGGMQLQHRAAEFIEAAESLPETVFSLSIGGKF